MDFDFTTETITPDSTTILTIGGTGALELPSGTTAQEPGTAVAGALRWNTTQTWVEYYNGTVWQPFTSPSSAVTSFQTSLSGLTPSTATTGAVTLAGTLGATSGGTGSTSAPTTGQFLYSSAGTTYSPTTLSSVAIVSVSGTAGNITASTASGAVTVNLATAGTAGTYGQVTTDSFGRVTSGVVINDVTHGGTGAATFTAHGVLLGEGTSAITATAVGATGTVLAGNTGADPTFQTLSGLAVTTFSAGSTGFTPNTATSGAVTLGGTLNLASGGTNASLTATAGGVVYSGASALAISAAGTTGQALISGGTGAPTWVNGNVTIGSTTIALGGTSTTLSGMTGITFSSGTVTGVANPVAATDVVNLSYLQSVIAGLEWKQEAAAASTTALTVTYSNGSSGVGATLTNAGTQAAFVIDGYTASVGDRILIKNQASQVQNGIYTVTNVGSASTNWVLTRAIDANTSASLNNATLFVTQGTTNANTAWTQTTANPTIGTSSIVFVQNAGTGTYTAGTGLTLTGNTFSLTSPVVATLGGTGTTTAPTTGQFLYSSAGTTYAPTGLSSVAVTTFSGGTTGLTPSSATSGAITLSGTLNVANGGTGNTTLTTNGVLYGNGTSAVQVTAQGGANTVLTANAGAPSFSTSPTLTSLTLTGLTANSFLYSGTSGLLTSTTSPAAGALLIGSGSGVAPVAATLTAGRNIYITNAAGSITIAGPKYWAESSTAPVTSPSATGNQSVAIGNSAVSSKYGQLTHSAGNFGTAGDAQAGEYILRNTTSNATPTALFLDGSSATLTIATGFAYLFDANIACISTTGTISGAWNVKGLITNFAGTAAIAGTISKTFIAVTPTTGSGLSAASVTATAASGALVFTVTGVAATTFNWVCTCKTTEVGAA